MDIIDDGVTSQYQRKRAGFAKSPIRRLRERAERMRHGRELIKSGNPDQAFWRISKNTDIR